MGASFFLWSLVLANVFISRKGFQNQSFFRAYMLSVEAIKKGAYHRFISSSFLHVDGTHLLFNMLTLYFFAPYVIQYFGGAYFYGIYFGSVILGGLISYAYHSQNLQYAAVGASGGVVGILFSSLLVYPEMRVGLLFLPIPMPGYVFVLIYLIYSVYGMRKQNDNVGHAAHLGGALGGLILSWLAEPALLVEWWRVVGS